MASGGSASSGGGRRRRRGSTAGAPPSTRPAWRQRIDSYGGLSMLAVGAALIAFIGVILWQNRPISPSDDPLLGEAMEFGSTAHVDSEVQLIIPEGEPPTGGPHFDQPLRAGIYEDPIPDGNAIHSLEHGMVWISYSPDLVTGEDIEALRGIADDHGNDTILSPRPLNTLPIAVVSWGRILRLDALDAGAIEDFIEVNTNRSPEPGVR